MRRARVEQRLRLLSGRRERLLAEHVAAGVQRGAHELGVGRRRRHDHDELDSLGVQHLIETLDDTRGRPPRDQRLAHLRAPGVDRTLDGEPARRQPVERLQVCRQHVARADEADADGPV